MTKLKDIVVETFSLYLILLNDHEAAQEIRGRIEGFI